MDSHFDDLIVNGRIIEISSQQKEHQHGTDNIIVDQGKQKDTGKNYRKYQIPYFISLKLFSVIYRNTHK